MDSADSPPEAKRARYVGLGRAAETDPVLMAILRVGRGMMSGNYRPNCEYSPTQDRKFRALFGCGPLDVATIWRMMEEHEFFPEGGGMVHMMWGLLLMKTYGTENMLCTTTGVDEKTFRKWAWQFISAIADLEPVVVSCQFNVCVTNFYFILTLSYTKIDWDNRKKGDQNNDCLTSVDGTDCKIPTMGRRFWSHKFKGSALRYEVAVSLLGGDIVWLNGPYPAGAYPDINIFRDSLKSHLDEGERVEADDGYIGEAPMYIKCPKSFTGKPEFDAMAQRARSRQETVNNRFKMWAILKGTFRADILKHGDVFRAIAVITQIEIENGQPLFSVHYDDENPGVSVETVDSDGESMSL